MPSSRESLDRTYSKGRNIGDYGMRNLNTRLPHFDWNIGFLEEDK
jgi:hypothetical protein